MQWSYCKTPNVQRRSRTVVIDGISNITLPSLKPSNSLRSVALKSGQNLKQESSSDGSQVAHILLPHRYTSSGMFFKQFFICKIQISTVPTLQRCCENWIKKKNPRKICQALDLTVNIQGLLVNITSAANIPNYYCYNFYSY